MSESIRFRAVRRRLIDCLREGRYRHEARTALDEKNLLAVGELSVEDVVGLLHRCRGDQHAVSAHHADRELVVHEFRPLVGERRWYVKAYLKESMAWIISVHEIGS